MYKYNGSILHILPTRIWYRVSEWWIMVKCKVYRTSSEQRDATRKSHDLRLVALRGRFVRVIFLGKQSLFRFLRHDTDYHLRRSCTILVASCFFWIISIVNTSRNNSPRQFSKNILSSRLFFRSKHIIFMYMGCTLIFYKYIYIYKKKIYKYIYIYKKIW